MSELPRILLCSFDVVPSPTGGSRRLTEYLKALAGRFSTVVLSTKTPDVSHIERYHGARLLRVPVGTGDLATRAQAFERAVKRQLESEEYALVHFMDPFGGYPLCEERTHHNYRVIYDAQSFPSQELRYTQPQLEGDKKLIARVRRQELYCLMNADLVLTGCSTTLHQIEALGVPPTRLAILRAPVDASPYKQLPEPTATPMRILYLGSQVRWQGLPTLIRALQKVRAVAPVTLTLCGPRQSEWQRRLEDLIAELNLSAAVTFAPPVPPDELPRVLGQCDVGVIPLEDLDRNRMQGGELAKASDYLAAGRPIVAAELPFTRELLPAAATRFYPAGNVALLAEALIALAQSPELRAQLGKAARAEALAAVASAAMKPTLLARYGALLESVEVTAPVGVREQKDATATATPTSRVFGRSEGSGPTPTGKVRVQVDADSETSAGTPKWALDGGERWKTRASGDYTPTGTFPLPEPPRLPTLEGAPEENVEEVQLEDIIERIDTFSGPAPRVPASPAPLDAAPGADGHDPWLAQLLYGYCPPDGVQFARHTPPTNFPGRDDTPKGGTRTPP